MKADTLNPAELRAAGYKALAAALGPLGMARFLLQFEHGHGDYNVRDYAGVEQLLVLANMEGMNAEFIHMGLPQGERLKRLNQIAIRQMQVLTSSNLKALPGAKGK